MNLADAAVVVDAFHVGKLATACVDDVRRRVQLDTTGRRGHKDDPLYGIRTLLGGARDGLSEAEIKPMRLFHYSISHVSVLFMAVAIDPIFHWSLPGLG
ncbi:transposase [Kytococcus sedentarius]|uniref:transposase n=1 Tax=Kytococcus sedentarius TaxID=1276 RepID=UPI00019EADAC|nr:transposase [Kytococcus sedentarius]QQB64684.1 transposase [Kytococcus sedentarius]STX12223.1 Uncharacterised protein [Kytococcus sedentarius]